MAWVPGLVTATNVVSGINEWRSFFQGVGTVLSDIRARWSSSSQEPPDDNSVQQLQDKVPQLHGDLWQLRTSLPRAYDLIDRAEWCSHKDAVAKLLPDLKDVVYDAEDLLADIDYYEQVEGDWHADQSMSSALEFLTNVIHGSFNKVTEIQRKLDHVFTQLDRMHLHDAPQRFEKSVRPETSSCACEPNFLGRVEEIEQMIKLLGVPTASHRSLVQTNRKRSRQDVESVSVLPIVGIGGVGKTTLVQEFCRDKRVKAHFGDQIVWVCVSDDFSEKRLTQEILQSFGEDSKSENLDCLQRTLGNLAMSKRFLLILDDMWDDDHERWQRFFAPLANSHPGSKIVVTTRSERVAKAVSHMEPFLLDGLRESIFWDFFKICAFGSKSFQNNLELECIGKSVVARLKGSPLAAKTLGRLLSLNLNAKYWNAILESELWELPQKETEILPALRLSYQYLPPHLKRCFSICSLYPKDYKFQKHSLVRIWVPLGFVVPEGDIPLEDIANGYFQELISRSFFQMAPRSSNKHVIHDLMHDMVQLVSKNECFMIKDTDDLQKISPNVRHLSIIATAHRQVGNLSSLCRYTKLRSIIFIKYFSTNITPTLESWASELAYLRLLDLRRCNSYLELPQSIVNLKHLRYLKGSHSVVGMTPGIGKLTWLEDMPSFVVARENGRGIGELKHLNQLRGRLEISGLGNVISKEDAAQAELNKKKYIDELVLSWKMLLKPSCSDHDMEVLEGLCPPPNLTRLRIEGYHGRKFHPSWCQQREFPALNSLIHISICHCKKLTSIEFLKADYLPAIKSIIIRQCDNLESLSAEGFRGLHCLENLEIRWCPKLNWERGISLPSSLKILELSSCGNISELIASNLANLTSLTKLRIYSSPGLTSISGQVWSNLRALKDLTIVDCEDLTSIGGSEAIARIKNVEIDKCPRLTEIGQPFHKDE